MLLLGWRSCDDVIQCAQCNLPRLGRGLAIALNSALSHFAAVCLFSGAERCEGCCGRRCALMQSSVECGCSVGSVAGVLEAEVATIGEMQATRDNKLFNAPRFVVCPSVGKRMDSGLSG